VVVYARLRIWNILLYLAEHLEMLHPQFFLGNRILTWLVRLSLTLLIIIIIRTHQLLRTQLSQLWRPLYTIILTFAPFTSLLLLLAIVIHLKSFILIWLLLGLFLYLGDTSHLIASSDILTTNAVTDLLLNLLQRAPHLLDHLLVWLVLYDEPQQLIIPLLDQLQLPKLWL